MTSNFIVPALIFIAGGAIIPLIRSEKLKSIYMLALPVFGLWNLIKIPLGTYATMSFLNFELVFGRVDKLSMIFGIIFHVISFLIVLYMLNFKDDVEYVSGFFYAGSALGAIFAGDLLTFFIFWEMLTLGSMFLILARKTEESVGSTYRYTLMHVLGGLFLLAGIVMYIAEQGSTSFTEIGLSSVSTYLIFIGIGINCAWPFVHTWVIDAYPSASIGGTIFLSALTTKTAVYALARGYPGVEALIWIGAAMTIFPIFFAVIENDLRRVLSYSIINQVGFMVVGIGIGTHLAVNGAVSHAVNDILFKALLFMSVGAVMYRTGKVKATELGGLYKSMPFTCVCCIVGALSISALPLFSGFVSKSMVLSAAGEGHMVVLWFILLFASAGVLEHAGIKIPFFAFFSHDGGHRVKEAPKPMLAAMGITAFLCIFIGCFPEYLYNLLPYDVHYVPYTTAHVVTQLQLLLFASLSVCVLFLAGIYPAEIRAINIDFDWVYRKGGRYCQKLIETILTAINRVVYYVCIEKITCGLICLAKNMPGHIAIRCLYPVWVIQGQSKAQIKAKKEDLLTAVSRSGFPIGYVGIISVIVIGLCLL